MRTNIEIDEVIMQQIIRLSAAKTRRRAIEEAIKRYMRYVAQAELLKLKGKIKWEGDLDEMRTSKYL